jgi:hypothetical protein
MHLNSGKEPLQPCSQIGGTEHTCGAPLRCTQRGARVQLRDARGGQSQSN